MGFRTSLTVSLTVIAVSLLPVIASAQNTNLGQPVQVQDVLTFQAGLELQQQSNLFNEADAQSDTILSGDFGVKFDRDFSLQRLTASGRIIPRKYVDNSNLDFLGYDAGLNWNWAIGRPWFGTLGIKLRQDLSSAADVDLNAEKNLQRYTNFYLTAGMRITPSWSLLAGFDADKLDNSSNLQRAADRNFVSTEFGIRYAPGTGTQVDLVYRRTDGKYPNRQALDALGLPLLQNIDNGFTQNSILARIQYKPNEDTTISGQAGVTNRSHDNLPDRDFSGATARLTMDWRPGGAFYMGVDLIRDISSEEILTANYVDLTGLRLRPSIRLTGKTNLTGLLAFENRDFGGDPNSVRKDKITRFGIAANWQYSRNILVTLGLSRVQRSSNAQNLDFNNNILTLGARINL